MEKFNINIIVREEELDDKKVFIVNNEELGVADFRDTLEKTINNFRKSAKLYLETYPEKEGILIQKEVETPPLVSRILL